MTNEAGRTIYCGRRSRCRVRCAPDHQSIEQDKSTENKCVFCGSRQDSRLGVVCEEELHAW